jgi:hypothetical protein
MKKLWNISKGLNLCFMKQKINLWAKLTHSREKSSRKCKVGYRYLLAEINAGNHLDGGMRHVALGHPVQGLRKHCPKIKKMVIIGNKIQPKKDC